MGVVIVRLPEERPIVAAAVRRPAGAAIQAARLRGPHPASRLRRACPGFAMTRARTQGGFTLIELLAVIVIMGMLFGLVMIRRPWHSPRIDMEASARALTGAFRLARSRAILQGRDVVVTSNVSWFNVDGGSPWLLPRGEAISTARIVFTPDGVSSGGPIWLSSGEERIAVAVNWLTGRVQANAVR
jgi:general secretion pathway protein H